MDSDTLILWSLFLGSFALYLIGTMVNVPWGSLPIPLPEVLSSLTWQGFPSVQISNDFFQVFALGAIFCVAYAITRHSKTRLFILSLAVVAPLVQVTIVMGGVMFLSPLMILSAFTGQAHGEFYVENMFLAAAGGLWMLSCLVMAIRHSIQLFHECRNRAEQFGGVNGSPAS